MQGSINSTDGWRFLGGTGSPPEDFETVWTTAVDLLRRRPDCLTSLVTSPGPALCRVAADLVLSPESFATGIASLAELTTASARSTRQGIGDEERVAALYARRLLPELLQNMHDAIASQLGDGDSAIGRFGIGVKGMAGVTEQVRLDSGPWRLRFGDPALRQLTGGALPLFYYPVPDRTDWPIRAPQSDAVGAFRLVVVDGATWLEVAHQGLPFDAGDVEALSIRGSSTKQTRQRESVDSPPVTTLAFLLKEEHVDGVRAALRDLVGADLLFLPYTARVSIDDGEGPHAVGCRVVASAVVAETELAWLKTTEGEDWLRARDSKGRALAVGPPGEHPLYSWFRIGGATTRLGCRLHLPALCLSPDRENLSSKAQDRRVNATVIGGAGPFVARMIAAVDAWLRTGIGGAALGLVESFPAPFVHPDAAHWIDAEETPSGEVFPEDADEAIGRSVLAALRISTEPCVACIEGDRVALRSATSTALLSRALSQSALHLLGSPMVGRGELAVLTSAAAEVPADVLRGLGCVRPSPEFVGSVIENVFAEVPSLRLGRALLIPVDVAAAAASTAAQVGRWLVEADLGTSATIPLAIDTLPEHPAQESRVRRPDLHEDGELASLYAELGWLTLDAGSYAGGLEGIERLLKRLPVVVDSTPHQVLRRLYEDRPNVPLRVVVKLASSCVGRLDSLLEGLSGLPILHAANTLRGYRGESWGDWGERLSFVVVHLAGLLLPTVSGSSRRASDLSRHQGVPDSLRVDREKLMEWLGESAAEALLNATSVTAGSPLRIRIWRPWSDERFSQELATWEGEAPPIFLTHTLGAAGPASSGRAVRRYQAPARSYITPASRRPLNPARQSGALLNDQKAPWHRCGGHSEGSRVMVLVDLVPEVIAADGSFSPGDGALSGEAYAETLGDNPLLRWTLLQAPDYQPQKCRATAVGDLPSAALIRLRQSPWLQTIDGSPVAPALAARWDGARLGESPARLLPIVPAGEWLNHLLVAPPLLADPSRSSNLDPRWLVGALFRTAQGPLSGSDGPDRLALYQRLLHHLVQAAGATVPRGGARPRPRDTWNRFFERSEALRRVRTSLADWLVDAVLCGFLDERAVGESIPQDSAKRLELWPVPVRAAGELSFERLGDLDSPYEDPVIFVTDGEEPLRAGIEAVFRIVELGRQDGLMASLVLRVPSTQRVPPPRATVVDRTPAARMLHSLLTVSRRDLLELAAATGRTDRSTLADRWGEGDLRVEALASDQPPIDFRGFEGRAVPFDAAQAIFRRSRGWRPGREARELVVGVSAAATPEEVHRFRHRLAGPLLEVLGLQGEAVRDKVAGFFLAIASLEEWESMAAGHGTPEPVADYLAAQGVGEDPATIQRAAEEVLERLAPVLLALCVHPVSVPTPAGSSSRRSAVPMIAWRSLAAELELDPSPAPWMNRQTTIGAGWDGLGGLLAALRDFDPDSVDEVLAAVGAQVCEAADGTLKDDLLRGILSGLRPWWSAWPSSPVLPSWRDLPGVRGLAAVPAEVVDAFSRALAEYRSGDGLGAASALWIREKDRRPLELLFRDAGLTPPGTGENRKVEWQDAVEEWTAVPGGALAELLTIASRRDWTPDAVASDPSGARRDIRSRLLDKAERESWPDMAPQVVAAVVGGALAGGDDLDPAEPGDASRDAVVLWLGAAADEHDPKTLRQFRIAIRGRVRIAGRFFLTRDDASLALAAESLPAPVVALVEARPGELRKRRANQSPKVGKPGRGKGGKRRFTAASGVLGRQGELYCRRWLATLDEHVEAWDTSSPTRAVAVWEALEGLAQGDGELGRWADQFVQRATAAVGSTTRHPGFDLLWLCRGEDGGLQAVGVEAKATDRDVPVLDVQLTSNEWGAAKAARTGTPWRWPVAWYRLVCLTRLWSPKGEAFETPRIFVLDDPLAKRKGVELEEMQQRPTWRLRVPAGLE
jgi:hypothetical protein